jgi:Cu(I)/Ag(I) efflux system membrane protein CusA/SilA
MINRLIDFCTRNRFLVFLLVAVLVLTGVWTIFRVPLDALPDISDTQVIVFSQWMGRGPDLVEDQVTYPIVSALLSAPKVKTVRGLSDFSMSYVYVIFEDGTDLYWARSRVLEYLSKIQGTLPADVKTEIGPDGTPVGWVYQYALVDRTGRHDLAQLRSIQDWQLRYALQSIEGVAEVAPLGGFVKQYQVNVDPNKLVAYNIALPDVVEKIRHSNQEVGGRLLELAGAEFAVRGRGYIKSVPELERVAVGRDPRDGTPVYLEQIADVKLGPDLRRGVGELDGEGEVVGGIVIMRYGENALDVIRRVKQRIEEVKPSLPDGVEIVPTYDRSELIVASINTLTHALTQELIVVSLVIIVFLFHFRSALVPIIALPIAVVLSFIPLYLLNRAGIQITSNIMSLGGIAIAIGVIVDASIVMVENAYRHVQERQPKDGLERVTVVARSAKQVGRAIFFSLLIIVVSFLPVFLLEAQEGRMFRPLAWTKSLSMLFSSLLAISLVPLLMTLLIRGKLRPEEKNPVTRFFNALYRPVIDFALKHRVLVLAINFGILLLAVPMLKGMGRAFMPGLYEGSLLYMPTAKYPGLSVTEATRVLQVQDKILRSQFPDEVERVFGKAGRAETSTDPAPFGMMETTIIFKPRQQWRKPPVHRWYSSWSPQWLQRPLRKIWPDRRTISLSDLKREMDHALQIVGFQNAFLGPIENRILMLSTGIRTEVGIKIVGDDLQRIEQIGEQIEAAITRVPGTVSVYAERVMGGYFVDFHIDREAVARYGLSVGDVQMIIESAIGGVNISTTVEGRERYPINVRYARELRDDTEKLQRVLVPVRSNQMNSDGKITHIPLAQLARIELVSGPAMIRDEDGLQAGYIYISLADRDVGSYVDEAKHLVNDIMAAHKGYRAIWSGLYEYQQRAKQRLLLLVPMVFFVIFILLYLTFHSISEAVLVMLSVVYAMFGGLVLQWWLGYDFTVAAWVGYIALYGVAVETGVIMVVYLHEALDKRLAKGPISLQDVHDATVEGSVLRLRPKLMTVSTTLIGLAPLMWATGIGSDMMKPIAAPMIGGMITSTIHVLIITPVIFALMKSALLKRGKLKQSEMGRELIG